MSSEENKETLTKAEVPEDKSEEQEEQAGDIEASPEIHFEPVIKLEQVETHTGEEHDECIYKVRAKMYRFDKDANEWKERGTGDLKLLRSQKNGQVRVLMRREKTHKICANHLIVDGMELKPNIGSDKSWLYQTVADFSEGESRPETLTVRFANAENAKEFKEQFEEAKQTNKKAMAGDDLTSKVSGLKLDEEKGEKPSTEREHPKDEKCEKGSCQEEKKAEEEAKSECKCPKDQTCQEKCVGCKCGCQV